jgi:hypothetical protein
VAREVTTRCSVGGCGHDLVGGRCPYGHKQPHPRAREIEAVYAAADETWKANTEAVILRFARTLLPFSAADVSPLVPSVREKRVMGALFNKLARAGYIKTTGNWVVNPSSNNNTSIRQWIGTGV